MEFTVEDVFAGTPERLYNAWLDSEDHSDMTGGDALITEDEGDPFTAWDGYIWGRTLELKPNEYIKQTWKTADFDEEQEYSIIEVTFAAEGDKTRVTIKHSGLEDKDDQYEQGWVDNYFTPMHAFFD